jgi:hypothetical protein
MALPKGAVLCTIVSTILQFFCSIEKRGQKTQTGVSFASLAHGHQSNMPMLPMEPDPLTLRRQVREKKEAKSGNCSISTLLITTNNYYR